MMVKDNTEMKAQSKTPCTKGFMPTDVIRSFVRLDPIRNSVIFRPIFDSITMKEVSVWMTGIKVLISIASTNRKMKYGTLIFFDSLLKMNTDIIEIGIIHNALSSFMVVAVCRASEPYLLAAPTTELVSCMAMAAQTPN